ncbi:hybrid sensor histidine kinase/response regulator [Pseudotabrizicola algicola]|uniref:histidine kinase n=1 Tax=Pseudotabrizicola algicola TaxID=2709381 RepID=A0A6B3RW96_9RHOB|nr:ATP-binding protein [Pseudotabrizicola algicola]NEX47402.1 response regulator [Pseudotabrizicola algicola]
MTNIPLPRRNPISGSVRLLAVVSLVLAMLGMVAMLALDVRARMSALERADSDNGQWVMMQTEVEVLRLQTTLIKAQTGLTDLSEVRRWFNVLYSRLTMLEQSPLYEDFIRQPENFERLQRMRSFTERWVTTIDSPDEVLTAALGEMAAQTDMVHQNARALSLDSLLAFSRGTDRTRARVSDTLTNLALTTGATMLLLGMLAAMATRLYRVTQRQAKENQIAGDRLQLIIATSPDAIVVTNRGGWVIEFNPAAQRMFGYTREEVMGRKILPLVFLAADQAEYTERLQDTVAKAVDSGPQRIELTGRRADGRSFPLEISLAVRDLKPGALIVGFLRDVSQRQADQQALEQALTRARAGEKAKADFLAVMSHEMRTPLNGLIGSIELMHDTVLNESQQELMRVMQVSGDILLGHVESVLDISRSESGQIVLADTPFALDRLIDDCIANQAGVARNGGNTIRHLALTGPLGTVRGDPGRLQQILLNLIGNAVKFTRKGAITVETERLLDSQTPEMVEIRVCDTGIGIPKADLDRVFEDFATVDSSYRREAGGTGLGLGIARRLVQAMGGSIGVESEPGEGSLFWLRLPLPPVEAAPALPAPEAPTIRTHAPPEANAAVQPLNVLVIEDNDINRFLVRRTLTDCNHHVTEATDGLQGVALADHSRYDVIITDISMPGLDGIEVARRIRAGGASVSARIIALTAHALPQDLERFRMAGMDACLTKPITRAALMAQLQPLAATPPPPGPSATRAAQPLLEISALRDLRDMLGQEATQSLIDRMLAEGQDMIARMTQVAPDKETGRLAHHLAGSSATFGAFALCEALSRVEQAIRQGEMAEAARRISALPALWQATNDALGAERALWPV